MTSSRRADVSRRDFLRFAAAGAALTSASGWLDLVAAEIKRTRLPGYPEATWRSLDDFMKTLEKRGSAINFAFYVGAANPREIVIASAVPRSPGAAASISGRAWRRPS